MLREQRQADIDAEVAELRAKIEREKKLGESAPKKTKKEEIPEPVMTVFT